MPTKQQTEPTLKWDASNVLDGTFSDEHEAKQFRELLYGSADGEGESSLSLLNAGQILQGVIVSVSHDFIIVDVGLKSEGLVYKSEFTEAEIKNDLQVGKKIEVFLDKAEGDDGQIVLSKEQARKFRAWEDLVNNCVEGSIREGKVLRKVKGGLMVDIQGLEAFLPGSQIDPKRQTSKMLDDLVGTTCKFKILKINIERKNVVVSRREILDEERLSRKAELLQYIVEGTRRKGIVKNITDFGVFLDLNGMDGLLHITDMSWSRIKHPSEMVSLNQELEVIILSVDQEKGRIALGLKQKDPNPYEQIEAKYPVGTRVKGKIVNHVPYGVFLEIEPGVEGLIHVSEMSWTKQIHDPSEMVRVGDEIEAVVLSIQKEDAKISLGIKQLERNPWEDVVKKYPVGSKVMAEIRNLTNYGAFVELEPGVDGLIHISDLSWTKKVSHPSEVLKKGDKIEAVILSVDIESKKITLGINHFQLAQS
jgi:small subunit ribosomal protein S1